MKKCFPGLPLGLLRLPVGLLVGGMLFLQAWPQVSVEGRSQVSIRERELLVNGRPYFIKGVTYSRVAAGAPRTSGFDFSVMPADIERMKKAGINTVRLYAPFDSLEMWDAFFEAGIRVIVGFPYRDDRVEPVAEIEDGSYLSFIEKYREHPAVLFWEFGNEYNYHPEWFESDLNNWYTALEMAAARTQSLDTSHPVSTAHGELPEEDVLIKCPSVDVWGLNIYRWDTPESLFDEWEALSEKALYISETGADSYDSRNNRKDEAAQARAMENIFRKVAAAYPVVSGVTFMTFADEWFKDAQGTLAAQDAGGFANAGVPYDGFANEEYWGVIRMDGTPKQAYATLQTLYDSTVSAMKQPLAPKPEMMPLFQNYRIDGKRKSPEISFNGVLNGSNK